MTGKPGSGSRCPLCGGCLSTGVATVPFIFPETVVLVKDVPAEVCNSCHEPYLLGKVTDRLANVVGQLRSFGTEVSIITYSDHPLAPTASRG